MTRIKNIISNQYHQLNLAERGRIETLRGLDWSIRRIVKALHRNPSTISWSPVNKIDNLNRDLFVLCHD